MNIERVTGCIGLAQRAGQLVTGLDFSLNEIRKKQTKLVLLDESASDNTKKYVTDACQYHEVAMFLLPQGVLGQACGKANRMVATVKPGGFSDKLHQLLADTDKQK